MRLNVLLSFIIFVILAVDCFAVILPGNYMKFYRKAAGGLSARKGKRKIENIIADKIIAFLNLPDSYFVPKKSTNFYENDKIQSKAGECNSLDDINSYFFDVYSSSLTKNLTSNDLESLIEFQVKRGPRSDEIESRIKERKCDRKKCFQSPDIFELTNLSFITPQDFQTICPIMLYNIELEHCYFDDGIWIFGLLFTSGITLWSWNGAIIFPIITKKIYKRVLTFMISLAFGCLCSNGLLKYIPLADGFLENDLEETEYTYFYKHLVVLFVIFFFFLFERSMKIFTIYKTAKMKKKRLLKLAQEKRDSIAMVSSNGSINDGRKKSTDNLVNGDKPEKNFYLSSEQESTGKLSNLPQGPSNYTQVRQKGPRPLEKKMSIDIAEINILGVHNLNEVTDKLAGLVEEDEEESPFGDKEGSSNEHRKPTKICCTSLVDGLAEVRPIGWMAIFGDGLGNFIDGLSIGASITQNLATGITTAVACWLSNIPQELGDFALLVRAGMSPFQALFYNYMSSNSAYVGCIIGIVFGAQVEAARWIFAISGATSLYLSLAVLLPEIKEEFEDGNEPIREKLKITAIQIAGIVSGYTIMIILNIYEESIRL